MTKLYNVLEAVRDGRVLTKVEQKIYDDGIVGTLRAIHDALDAAVAEAYGWPVDLSEEDILQRLVDLNAARAAEEAQGLIRWLRPDYQNPTGTGTQTALETATPAITPSSRSTQKIKWTDLQPAERIAAVRRVITTATQPLTVEAIAAQGFQNAPRKQVEMLVESLASLGLVEEVGDGAWVG